MKNIHRYNFFKKKYGAHLLADVVRISEFRKYIQKTPTHRLTYFDLTFITEGNEYVTINQSKLRVQCGDVICSTPGDVWTWERNTALEGFALVFEEDFFQSFFINKFFLNNLNFLKADRLSPFIGLKAEVFSEILEFLEKIRNEIKGKDRSEHVIRAFVYLVLAKLDNEEKLQNKSSLDTLSEHQNNRHLQGFIKLVEEHCLEVHEVQFYADKLFISANYLNKIVRELLGTTSKKYIASKIAQEARNLLNFTDLSISEISDQLKFESPSYFTRFFKKSVGLKPKEFRVGNKPS
ncbi:helix-turn-helix domain-containing protein [Pedobacter sp. ISL-68]|uniref:helix-turn-helix domain-containing protein n=1 Tax=unclassified Pedobacter TaxID=2628915 RepID=UPI001BE9649C|nr:MULTISPECIES: AraC family transcriptional regulator [unclassified Pedobacter]MBT2561382.1 helix-turn-helix domain-containing protein [Pedobacter sp. ISL-64]MBT2590771.1 helix-turn-helix domain-containing protein [Pedobacter sp. ISL-68]